MSEKTFHLKKEEIKRSWRLIDAENKVLGRLASQTALILMGKDKPSYSPHLDAGDMVVVFNCEKIKLTGDKLKNKTYKSHSGYPGGFKEVPLSKMLKEHPERVIIKAVSGMLPNNKLKKLRLKRLRVFQGESNPELMKIKDQIKK